MAIGLPDGSERHRQKIAPAPRKRRISNRQIDLLGWFLFTGSALAFLVASWGDPWGMTGSLLFLVACIVFIIPFYRRE